VGKEESARESRWSRIVMFKDGSASSGWIASDKESYPTRVYGVHHQYTSTKHTGCNQFITNLEIHPILPVFPYGITHDDGGEAGALEDVRGPGLRRRGRRGVQGGENADEDEEAIHLPEDVLCAGILEQDAVDFGEGLLYSTCSCYRQQCILLCM
jgi:hypothetical protein